MATIREHNHLMRCVLGNTKHFKHILTRDDLSRITGLEKRYPVSRRPVCEHCESVGWWRKGKACFCPTCGTITKHPITLSEYYIKGYDLDGSRSGLSKEVKITKIKRDRILPVYR